MVSIFLLYYVSITMPPSAAYEMGPEQWPQLILTLLIISLAYGIYKESRELKANGYKFDGEKFKGQAAWFFKSRLFFGILALFFLASFIEPIGFLPTT